MRSEGFVVQRRLHNLFSMQKVSMLTDGVSKIIKSVLSNISFIVDALSENVVTFVRMY